MSEKIFNVYPRHLKNASFERGRHTEQIQAEILAKIGETAGVAGF